MLVLRKLLAWILLRILRVKMMWSSDGLAKIEQGGKLIVTANHVSLLDGIIIALVSPVPLTFAVDPEFSVHNVVSKSGLAVLAWLGYGQVVPLQMNSPYGLRKLLRVLDGNLPVMIFPEGEISRDGKLGVERRGVTWLAERTGAPIIRVQILGAERSRIFAKAGKTWWPRITIVL